MHAAHELVGQLSQAYRQLDVTLTREEVAFSAFARQLGGTRCPPQEELAPFLHGVQAVARTLAEFLQVLTDFLNDPEAIALVRDIPPEQREVGSIPAYRFLPFYDTIVAVYHEFRRQSLPMVYPCDHVWQLCVEFAYFAFRVTATQSLIAWLDALTGMFCVDADSSFWDDQMIGAMRKYLNRHAELIQGLHSVAERAVLLQRAAETAWSAEYILAA
jgi:hypothetical protein